MILTTKHVAIGALTAAALGFGYFYFYKDKDESLIYDGVIDGKRIIYQEKANRESIMIVYNGKSDYILKDVDGTSIDWKADKEPNYQADSLEEITIYDSKSHKFRKEDVSDSSIEGQQAKTILEKGTKYYNEKRKKIRDKKIEDYGKEMKGVEDFFGN